MSKTEPCPVIHRELQFSVAVVIVPLGVLLGLEKTLANLRKEGAMVMKERIRCLHLSSPGGVGQEWRWWSAVDHLEGCGATVLCPRKLVNRSTQMVPSGATGLHCDHLIDDL